MTQQKYLSGCIGRKIPFGNAQMFQIAPWEKGASGHYGFIRFRKPDHKDISGRPCGRCIACLTKILDRNVSEELNRHYLPGGISIEYVEQSDGDWLVCFKAQNILASDYMRLAADEMSVLLNQADLLE